MNYTLGSVSLLAAFTLSSSNERPLAQAAPSSVPELTVLSGQIISGILANSPEGAQVQIQRWIYTIQESIIPKKGQQITGVGIGQTILRLGDHVNQPVVLIRQDDITISNLSIDGNQTKQDQERSVREEDKNDYTCVNGITVYRCKWTNITNVDISNCRSAGFCGQFGVENMHISGMTTRQNYIDGWTLYEAVNVTINNLISKNNPAAGISMDCDNGDVTFINPQIEGNGTCVYIRASQDITFQWGNLTGRAGEISQNLDYRHNPFAGMDVDGKCRNILFQWTEWSDKPSLQIKDGSVVHFVEKSNVVQNEK